MPTKRKTTGDNHQKNTEGRKRSLANLRPPWQPGQSGNPAGRPKAITLSEAYRRALAEEVPDDPEGHTYAEVIAAAVVKAAATGSKYDMAMARELADRIEGRPRQALDVDLTMMDWNAQARESGFDLNDVLNEAQRLVHAAIAERSAELEEQEDRG